MKQKKTDSLKEYKSIIKNQKTTIESSIKEIELHKALIKLLEAQIKGLEEINKSLAGQLDQIKNKEATPTKSVTTRPTKPVADTVMALLKKHVSTSEAGNFMTPTDIRRKLIKIYPDATDISSVTIGRALKSLKYEKHRPSVDGKQLSGYFIDFKS
jgi:hypothetical protein